MVHIIQLALRASMSSFGETGSTKSWEAHACNRQFGQNESIDIGKRHRLRKEANARINKLSAMRPCLAKIMEKVFISRQFESAETVLHIGVNACCIDSADIV